MASSSQKKRPASGGGKKTNNEPRIQIFKDFSGCNFQMSPRNFDHMFDEDDQTDLQMNYVVIQNNAHITPNKTIETRQNIETLFTAPDGLEFTGISQLIGNELYIATNDSNIQYGKLGEDLAGTVTINDIDEEERDNSWTHLSYADDKLVGMTAGLQLWTGELGTYTIENARTIPTPAALNFSQLKAMGSLTISPSLTTDHPFRISLRYTLLNKYGPTLPSPPITFFANKTTVEWSASAFLNITGTAPDKYAIVAVELYYTEDEYQDPAFLARVDMQSDANGVRDGGAWVFNWTGYLFDTSMWTIANLTAPTENYTAGVPASKMDQHDGRLYFWGGEPSYRLWVGGNPGNLFSVSTGVGGGFADAEPGTGQSIKVVKKFKTQGGAAIVTMLCDNLNSNREHRFNLVENNITLSNEQSAKGYKTEKIAGTVGCKSFYGAGVWADGLYAVSRYGLALTTLVTEYNNQLRVVYVSDPISPVFIEQYGNQLDHSILLCVNDIIYMAFGKPNGDLDNILFCYDIDRKAWWTYTVDVNEPILNMINIDYEGSREGIGIITPQNVYLLPTTKLNPLDTIPTFEVLIETAELGTSIPLQNMHHLTQLEFRFDYFIGDLSIDLICIDQFGRKLITTKNISHDTVQNNLVEYMRVDQKVMSYKLVIKGEANFRLTHWMAKVYPMSSRVGLVWGFDDRQSHNSEGDIHRYFKCYNDLRKAIIP